MANASPDGDESQCAAQTLLLFDIDGTLISTGGAGERALRLAVQTCFGVEDDLKTIEIAGRTDTGIARQIIARYAQPESRQSEFQQAYLGHLADELPRIHGKVLPGVFPLLESLRAQGYALGLLTGNLLSGAEKKLKHYGLWEYFPFGAFADDHYDRNLLGPFALQRAQAHHSREFAPQRVFILGDTPHDITCGRAIGAQTVGVATGNFSTGTLLECNADHVFQDFADTQAVLTAIRNGSSLG